MDSHFYILSFCLLCRHDQTFILSSGGPAGSQIDIHLYHTQMPESYLESEISIHVLGDSRYLASGGCFDRNGSSPSKVRINGCTWGGNIIKTDYHAACGMHLEFNNGVVTTTIQKVIIFHGNGRN